MRSLRILAIVLALPAALLGQAGPKPTSIPVPAATPRAVDVGSIDGMVQAYYDVISGPPGKPREWSRDRTLYVPGQRFFAIGRDQDGRVTTSVMDHQQYVDSSDARFVARGFFEKEIHRVAQRFGDIAHVWSTYETREKDNGPVTARGVNSLQLYWDGKRWWIVSSMWTDERPDNSIPKEYLP